MSTASTEFDLNETLLPDSTAPPCDDAIDPEFTIVPDEDDDAADVAAATVALAELPGDWVVSCLAMSATDTLAEIATAEQECLTTEDRIAELREELKEAKAAYERRVSHLRRLCGKLSASGNGRVSPSLPPTDQPAASPMDSAVDSRADDSAPIDDWRSVLTTELDLAAVKGLGEKKREALLDLCPTLGQLEDLRAGQGGLTQVEGIGQGLAGKIEERILTWLSANRDRVVLQAAAAGAVAPADSQGGEVDISEI